MAKADVPITLPAIQALINRTIIDPAPTHELATAIYADGNPPKAEDQLTKKELLLLSRVRSGHSKLLRSYNTRISTDVNDSLCRHCKQEEETIRHIFDCPALTMLRAEVYGRYDPALSTTSRPKCFPIYQRQPPPSCSK